MVATMRKLLHKATWLIDRMSDTLADFGVLILVVLTGLIIYTVIMRYVFNSPYKHGDEIASYMMVGIVFLGLAYTLRTGGHIAVRIVTARLSPRVRSVWQIVLGIIGIIWAGSFAYGCFIQWMRFYTGHTLSIGLLYTPLWLPALAILVGSAMLLLQLISYLVTGEIKEDKSQW